MDYRTSLHQLFQPSVYSGLWKYHARLVRPGPISDSMDEVRSNHAEYADDSGVWSSDESLPAAAKVVNQDLVTEKKWCSKWNMLIAADKTEVMIFPWDGR